MVWRGLEGFGGNKCKLIQTSVLFSTGSGRIALENCSRDYFRLLQSPDLRLLVLKCAGSYSRVFTTSVSEIYFIIISALLIESTDRFT